MASFIFASAAMILALAGLCQAGDIPVNWQWPLAQPSINAACGDHLVFSFGANFSVVQIASKDCNSAIVKNYGKTSAVTVPLSKAGTTYYTSKARISQCKDHKQLLTVKTTCNNAVTHLLTTATGHPEWSDEYGAYNTVNAKCGDKLRFKWAGDEHDIVQFNSVANYDKCNFIGATVWSIHHEDWDTTITLTEAGTTYYGCTVHDHCEVGMKVKVVTTC